jgi:hypothetical protein
MNNIQRSGVYTVLYHLTTLMKEPQPYVPCKGRPYLLHSEKKK